MSAEDALNVRTAFLVVQHDNGEWEAVADVDKPVKPEHAPSVLEIKFGASEVVSDIDASKQAVQNQSLASAQVLNPG